MALGFSLRVMRPSWKDLSRGLTCCRHVNGFVLPTVGRGGGEKRVNGRSVRRLLH